MLHILVLHSAALLVIATRCVHRTQVGRDIFLGPTENMERVCTCLVQSE